LPFRAGQFDLTFCHFLLLWLQDPLAALKEMSRVTQPGGYILALAEPDYGGRIDFPPELEVLGNWQTASLRAQGAHPLIGRRLGWLFRETGLQQVETGVLGAQWQGVPGSSDLESEWTILYSDMEQLLGSKEGSRWKADFNKLKRLDETSWMQGERVLFVPTFYAIGKKPV
jgi:SAM-dependent methyltransferase